MNSYEIYIKIIIKKEKYMNKIKHGMNIIHVYQDRYYLRAYFLYFLVYEKHPSRVD